VDHFRNEIRKIGDRENEFKSRIEQLISRSLLISSSEEDAKQKVHIPQHIYSSPLLIKPKRLEKYRQLKIARDEVDKERKMLKKQRKELIGLLKKEKKKIGAQLKTFKAREKVVTSDMHQISLISKLPLVFE